jgi:hypothetical protein
MNVQGFRHKLTALPLAAKDFFTLLCHQIARRIKVTGHES